MPPWQQITTDRGSLDVPRRRVEATAEIPASSLNGRQSETEEPTRLLKDSNLQQTFYRG
jgi:hypothetical protein